jgi:hypothetical protein
MGIISRIEEEIDRLNEQILEGSTFENRDSVNLNALVCLLRYAAWRKPDVLKKWFTREGTETSINKNVVKRFSLYENEKNPDGAQLRIHIFDDAKETAKHDHQRDFITMCIQGAYAYKYYRVDECDKGGVVQYFNRIDGGFVKADPPSKPGKIVRVKHTNETWNDEKGEKVGDDYEKVFDPSVGPLYVNSNWIHTVSPKYTEADSVITVLIRRQREKGKKTIFIRGPNDDEFEEEEPPNYNVTPKQIDDMFEKVRKALVGESTQEYSGQGFDSNAISEFMNPTNKLVRVSPKFIQDKNNLQELVNFMNLNDFSSCPVSQKADGKEKIVKLIDANGNFFFSENKDWMDSKTPILFGILYTVLSKRLVIPIVNESTDEFLGILSLFDVVNNIKRFANSIFEVSIDSNDKKAIVQSAKLISGLNDLQTVADENKYHIRGKNPELFNSILTPLGSLILNKELANLTVPDENISTEKKTWMETISNTFFQVDETCNSVELLSEIKEMCDFDTFAQRNQDNSFTKIYHDGTKEKLETIGEDSGPQELIEAIRNGMWPVYVNIESKKQVKIISTDELFSFHSLRKLAPELQKIKASKKVNLLSNLLIKSNLKEPNFNSNDFEDVKIIFGSE